MFGINIVCRFCVNVYLYIQKSRVASLARIIHTSARRRDKEEEDEEEGGGGRGGKTRKKKEGGGGGGGGGKPRTSSIGFSNILVKL